MRIGIDFDGVINNMLETWIEDLNRMCGASVKVEDIVEWEVAKQYPYLDKADLFSPLDAPDFWDRVTIKPDAPEVIKKLIAEGHEIYIITSSHYRNLMPKLERCLFVHFPYLTKNNIIVTFNKSLIKVDLLLDDGAHNFKDFEGIKVIFDAPYNKTYEKADYRVAAWKEFYILVAQLADKKIRPPFTRILQFKAGRGMGKTAWLQEQIYNSEVPCYIVMSEQRYRYFCRSYLERYHKVCPAILYNFKEHPSKDSRFFADMPSTFPVESETFEAFKNIFIKRDYLFFIADFENTYWYAV